MRDPFRSLASVTCAYEGICDGAALAQVGVVRTTWANVYLSWIQRCDRERWKRDETLRLANARQTKQVNDSQPPLHVDIMYATTIHAFCPRELNDWTKRPSGQARAKECDVGMHAYPFPGRATIRGIDPSDRKTRKEEK
jgi:hypothetical protein